MAKPAKLLAADADASVREVVRIACAEAGWPCDTAPGGIEALKQLRREKYRLVILEAELPEIDGLVVCRQLRKTSRSPVIFVSAKSAEADRLAGFAAGGNDYLQKPFYPRELVARAASLMELCGGAPAKAPAAVQAGPVRIDLEARAVFVDGRRVQMAPKEFDLLLFFAQNPNQAFSRNQLLDLVWGPDFMGGDRTVDTHVKGLRGKLRPFQTMVETLWGYGYKFVP